MRGTWICLFASLLALGCSKPAELFPVRGRLVLDSGLKSDSVFKETKMPDLGIGRPIAGATLAFRNEAGTSHAQALTDSQGRFSVETLGRGLGAIAGTYKVTIESVDKGPEIPTAYKSPGETPLVVEVGAGGVEDVQLVVKKPK